MRTVRSAAWSRNRPRRRVAWLLIAILVALIALVARVHAAPGGDPIELALRYADALTGADRDRARTAEIDDRDGEDQEDQEEEGEEAGDDDGDGDSAALDAQGYRGDGAGMARTDDDSRDHVRATRTDDDGRNGMRVVRTDDDSRDGEHVAGVSGNDADDADDDRSESGDAGDRELAALTGGGGDGDTLLADDDTDDRGELVSLDGDPFDGWSTDAIGDDAGGAGPGALAMLDAELAPGDATAGFDAVDAAAPAGAQELYEQGMRHRRPSPWGRLDVGVSWRRRWSAPIHAPARRYDELWLVATWRR